MKVTVADREVEEGFKRVYPYLGEYICKSGSTKVIFTSERRGVLIEAHPYGDTNIFVESDNYSESHFTPLVNKTITIEV